MFKTWIITIVVMVAVAANHSFAFVVDRSAAAAAAWDSAPILEIDNQKGSSSSSSSSMDRVLNGKIQVTGMDKILQSSEAKKQLKKQVDDTIIEDNTGSTSREKRSEVVIIDSNTPIRTMKSFKDIKEGGGGSAAMKFFNDNNNDNDKQDSNNLPKNVVLLLIDETKKDNENLLNDNFKTKHEFPVQGFLQSCRNNNDNNNNNNNIQLKYNRDDDSMIFEKKNENNDCECEHFLRTNIGALLSWARHAKIMSTGAVSVTNFSIPAAIGYETGSGIVREFDDNNVKREIQRTVTKPELRDAWRLIDMDRKPSAATAGTSTSSSSKTEGGSQINDGGMWDVFDMFSRIRVAFFRTLLDSLGGNLSVPEDEFPPRRSSPHQSNLADLVGDTIKELKSASNEKGYMLVAAAPGNDLSSTVDLLNNEISEKDTLLVVAGICSKDKKPVPFYASGPGAKSILDARSVWDLPGAIKTAVTGSGCRGSGCRIRRHDQNRMTIPRDSSASSASASASLIPTAEDSGDSPSLRRVGRQEGEEGGAASGISADVFTVMLSLATSVVATFAVKF